MSELTGFCRSGANAPFYERGTMMWVTNNTDINISPGDLIVFPVPDRKLNVCHRVVEYHESFDGKVSFSLLYS